MSEPTVTDVKKLIINLLTSSDYQALVNSGQVSPTELYMTTDELYATQDWVTQQGFLTQAVDDNSTTSTTLGWSASKLNGIIGDIESTINAIRGV